VNGVSSMERSIQTVQRLKTLLFNQSFPDIIV